jgi:hypothetical protein
VGGICHLLDSESLRSGLDSAAYWVARNVSVA